jgi:DNA polymerase-3 subunit delta'
VIIKAHPPRGGRPVEAVSGYTVYFYMGLHHIRGQEDALRVLRGAMRRGRVASTYLFAGEQGVGKRLTAVAFVKALNCLSPSEQDGAPEACGRCASCRKIEAGTHPDFLLIEPEAGLIKVQEIRRLEEALYLRPYEGRWKAVVVDDAEAMNPPAANAFLKTLEEPAPQSLIVLVSSRPGRLPQTVLSRCSRVNFKPLPPALCAEVIGAGAKEPELAARLSMGRPGLALGEDLVRARTRFLASLGKMAEEARPTWKDREEMEKWLDMAFIFLRDLAAGGLGGEPLMGGAERMAGEVPLEALLASYEKLRALKEGLVFHPNRAVTWNYAGSIMRRLGAHV